VRMNIVTLIMVIGAVVGILGLAIGSLTNLEKTGKTIALIGVVILIIPLFLLESP
jgi:hypothetical protein